MPDLEVIIGLEVHAQMNTKTKMFCGCDNDAFGKEPNTTVCPICMGHPGTLPVPNQEAIAKAVKASLAIGCTVNASSHFDRKHYFYPDLPAGFQISQYDFPLSSKGEVTYELNGGEKVCRITRLHMENDAGKLTHRGDRTLCDYNRAGTPLMEIVTEPDLRSADEAVAFAEGLRRILIAVGASDADMFKGMMRFDASISLRERGTEKLNPRSEIKNLNSFKALERALAYEEKRLRELWEEQKGPMKNDITVGWLDDEGKTRMLRNKETADDYRYFPEPDIPPMQFDISKDGKVAFELGNSKYEFTRTEKGISTSLHVTAEVEPLRLVVSLPQVTATAEYFLPNALRKEYLSLGLTAAEVNMLIDESELRERFDVVHTVTKDGKRASSLVLTQLTGFLKEQNKTLEQGPSAAHLVDLAKAIASGQISGNAAKDVLEKMVTTGKSPTDIIAAEGMQQISDTGAIEKLVAEAIAANPKAIESYRAGKGAALGAIVGWVMKQSKGQANPKMVNEILMKRIR